MNFLGRSPRRNNVGVRLSDHRVPCFIMFSRIFNLPRKEEKKDLPCEWHISLDDFQAAPRLPKFDKNAIRVLVFKDCEKKGKSLVFDSDAVVEVKEDEILSPKTAKKKQNALETPSQSPGSRSLPSKYKFLKPKSDIKMLGEMIFGSVTMAYRGSIVKVHHIRTPPQLLLTKVFAVRSRSSASSVCDNTSSNSFSRSTSMPEQGMSYSSDSITIPTMSSSPNRSLPGSVCIPVVRTPSLYSRSNLSLTSNQSIDSISESMVSLHSPSPSPGSSLNRRWHRSQMTRLNNYQHSKLKLENSDEVQAINRRQPKIGIGVVFKLWESHEEKNRVFQNFLFCHYSLFEGHVQRLKIAIEKSFHSKKNFYVSVIEAIECFKQDILSFYSAPRLLEPVWLNMMNIRDKQEEIAERFMATMMKAMDIFEKKEESYFLSSLLTAVLTHHLAWVPTVMPSGTAPKRAYLDKHSSLAGDVLAKCHPYNPLWAQLSDLYGTLGYPSKVTKTIVVGKDPTLVRQLLYILSYFIRCSEIKEYSLKMQTLDDLDNISIGNSDDVSCCSETPTNTPNVDSWPNFTEGKENCSADGNRSVEGTVNSSQDIDVSEKGKAFEDHEEICDCMCSVLQSIDYIGSKGLRNRIKFANAMKIDKTLAARKKSGMSKAAYVPCRKNGLENSPDKKKLEEYVKKYPSFRCYCCPEKHSLRNHIENTAKLFPRQISGESMESVLQDDESKSCVCGDKETSEYGSETRSSQFTLSRNSSCGSCSDYFRKFESISQDLDSDYCSIANEENAIECQGIELKLREISNDSVDSKSVEGENDELQSMNLVELPMPDSDKIAVPQRHFDHKVQLPNFGRSLLAGYCDKFVSDFALHGVRSIDMPALERELHLSLKYSVLDETISEAAYIVADVDKRTCQLVSLSKSRDYFTESSCNRVEKSELFGSAIVSELLESLKGLWQLNIPYQFCLMHLEDRLKDIYCKSKLLAEFVKTHPESMNKSELQQKMRFCESDLDLVIATGSTHFQFLQQGIE